MKTKTAHTLSLLALIALFASGCATGPETTSLIDYANSQIEKGDQEVYIMPLEYITEKPTPNPNNTNDHIYGDSSHLRSKERIGQYRVYAYTDENDPNIRHSSHNIHRVETTAHWNYNLDTDENVDSRSELKGDVKSYEIKPLLDVYGQGVQANSQAITKLAYAIQHLQTSITNEKIDEAIKQYDLPHSSNNLEAEKPTDTMNDTGESERESDSSTS